MDGRLRKTITLAALAVVASSCGEGVATGPITGLPRELSVAELRVVDASTTFAFDMLRHAPATPDSPNVFLSPLSASMALGMAMNGTAADTWSQMRDVLGFGGMEEADINAAYRGLIELLRGLDPRVELGVANSVWARDGYPFHADFMDRARTWFDARVQELPFDDGALDIINGWVEDETRGRITELLKEIPDSAIMYLINAVYFNGDWTYAFPEDATAVRAFHRADGGTRDVEMMAVESDFRRVRTDVADVVELPYGGGAFSAIAVLPDGAASELVAGLDAVVWADWMARIDAAEPHALGVVLPELELEYERTLNGDLQSMGMTDAFSEPLADFTRLTPRDGPAGQGPPWVFISEVKQKTFLKVDESGTEAAAATSVEIVETTSAPSVPRVVFDRPFLFAIRERFSGAILFIGVIGDPE